MPSLRSTAALACILCMFPAAADIEAQDRRPAGQIADSIEIARVARGVTSAAQSDSARAALLYEWVATGVKYDVAGFLAGRPTDDKAEGVYRGRLAVCAGFVALYARMGREVGLEIETIKGYAKGFNYVNGQATGKPNHAWLAVKVDKAWRLVDPTWGAGTVSNGVFQPRFLWDYFFVSPEALQLSHFPEESSWQLVRDPLSRKEFERMPPVPRVMVALGFDPVSLKRAALKPGAAGFPLVADFGPTQVRVMQAPVDGTLSRSAPVSVDLIWPGVEDVALVTGGAWTPLARNGERFQGQTQAAGVDVFLVGRRTTNQPYETLIQYKVK